MMEDKIREVITGVCDKPRVAMRDRVLEKDARWRVSKMSGRVWAGVWDQVVDLVKEGVSP